MAMCIWCNQQHIDKLKKKKKNEKPSDDSVFVSSLPSSVTFNDE